MDFDAIVIGTGFGGTIAATRLAAKGKKVLILERGTWWVTPAKIGKAPPSSRKPIPVWAKEQQPPHPVQYWTRPDNRQGLLDFFAAIRSGANKDGLYQYSIFKQADILTASGVGGGSLIYSNVTVRPHPEVLQGIMLNLGVRLLASGLARIPHLSIHAHSSTCRKSAPKFPPSESARPMALLLPPASIPPQSVPR